MLSQSAARRVPKYRRHKPTGQAVVTLSGKDFYLGKWNTKSSRREYDRLIGEWLAAGRCLPPGEQDPAAEFTIAELCVRISAMGQPTAMPDLIFLDLNMPEMNGRQVLQVLRSARHQDRVDLPPVVVLTASDNLHPARPASIAAA